MKFFFSKNFNQEKTRQPTGTAAKKKSQVCLCVCVGDKNGNKNENEKEFVTTTTTTTNDDQTNQPKTKIDLKPEQWQKRKKTLLFHETDKFLIIIIIMIG